MKKVSLKNANLLLRLRSGEILTGSEAKSRLIENLIAEGILWRTGRVQKKIGLQDADSLKSYLENKYGIADLEVYMQLLQNKYTTRSDLVKVASDSKLRRKRSFKGFLINHYQPIKVELNGEITILKPLLGSFRFIYDFENFIPSEELTIVGVENAENFRFIEKQKHLFTDIKPLFVSRYPQSQHKDLIRWLQEIPNPYLHFGDFDLVGIAIYLNEYKKHLGDRAHFFIPENIEELFQNFGNPSLYDIQTSQTQVASEELQTLIDRIHYYRKGVEQEVLIRSSIWPREFFSVIVILICCG